MPTLPRCSPGSRESKTPVEPRFTTAHLQCSTKEPRFVPVYPGVTQVVYGDVPVTAGCATVTCRLGHGCVPVLLYTIKPGYKHGVTSVFFCLYRITVMTQIGLHIHIRVTRGIMICVAKAKLPSNLAAHLHDK